MKRDLFYAIAIALCGLVSFTSCTKDYDDDLRIQRELIENNEKELRALIDAYQVLVGNTIEQIEIAYKNADDLIKQEMKAEFDAAKQRLTALETALDAAESNIAALASDLVTFKAAVNLDFQRINANIEAINARIDDADQKIAALDTRLTTVEAALADLKAWKTLAEAKLAELEKSQEADKAEIEALKTRIAAAEERISALEQQHAALELAMKTADDALNKRIDDLIAAMESRFNLQTTTLTELITNVQIALTDDMAALRAEMQQFKLDINLALDEYKQEIDTRFEEIAMQFQQITSEMRDMSGSIANLGDYFDELNTKVIELTARIAGLASAAELKALSERVDGIYLELRARDKELEVLINANKDEIAARKAEIEALKKQLADLEAALDQKIADAIADKVTKTEMDTAIEAAVAQLTADYQAADQALQDLIDVLNNTTIPAMMTRLETIETYIDGLKNRIQALRWLSDYPDGALRLEAKKKQDNSGYEYALLSGYVYVVSNNTNIINILKDQNQTDYKIETIVNQTKNTRAIVTNPFGPMLLGGNSNTSTLSFAIGYLDMASLWTSFNAEVSPKSIGLQMAVKITDKQGNTAITDFADIVLENI